MAGDPFLSDPSRKRKRNNRTTSTTHTTTRRHSRKETPQTPLDEDISGSETDDENAKNGSLSEAESVEMSSDEEFEHENAADKRRRLAKQYLENLKNEEATDDFSAKDLDDDNIGKRLQRDVAENKGQIFKFYGNAVASQIEDIHPVLTRIGCKNLTGLAAHHPFLYTVSKDMEIIKWDITKKKPIRTKHTKGGYKYFDLRSERNHHYDAINCVAASPDGRYLVTGGADGRLIIWSTENLASLKVLETRSSINSISFRRNSDQLYAACADLKVRTYSISQFSQLEILYGHQDNITDISGLSRETCVSVGSRDRTALYWKIADESRLTFRGGDSEKAKRAGGPFHSEGSLDVVTMVDESHFVTGSDNGNVSLWSLAKKKPLFTKRLAHGLQPQLLASQASGEANGEGYIPQRTPHWITAVHAVPFTDVFITGSYSGEINVWRIDRDNLRTFELVGKMAAKGVINKIDSTENEGTLAIYAAVSKEHRLGRWLGKVEGRNSLVSFAFKI